jgi:hypothetical protein
MANKYLFIVYQNQISESKEKSIPWIVFGDIKVNCRKNHVNNFFFLSIVLITN